MNVRIFVAVALTAFAVIATALLLMHSGAASAPTESQFCEALLADIRSVAPIDARECGLIPLGVARAEAIACANASIATKSAFWVAFQERGEDSIVWQVVFGDTGGPLKSLSFDAQPFFDAGNQIKRHLSVGVCSNLAFNESGPSAIRCTL